MTVRVVIADQEAMFVEGIALLLRQERDFEVVGRAQDFDAALRAVYDTMPDVAVLGGQMRGGSALDAVRALRAAGRDTAIVLLVSTVTQAEAIDALRLDVAGVVLKAMPSRLLMQCIRKVHAGGAWIEKESIRRAIGGLLRMEESQHEHAAVLSVRELDVVRAVAKGLRNRQVAEKLLISECTVKVHLSKIFEKLRLSSRVELTLYAQEKGLV